MAVGETIFCDKEEMNYRLYDFNTTNKLYPQKTVCKLFVEQAIKRPDKTALEFGDILFACLKNDFKLRFFVDKMRAKI